MSITLKKLAELSGFSVRTVSRVLQNKENVIQDKRDLILRLAKEHHYTPNMAARNLRLQKKNFVGIICSELEREALTQKLNDLERRLIEKDYYPVLGRIRENAHNELEKMLTEWSGTIEYVVVLSVFEESSLQCLTQLAKVLPLRFIFADCNGGSDHPMLSVDRETSIADAIAFLFTLGYRRILHCGTLKNRIEGVRRAFEKAPHDASLIFLKSEIESMNGHETGDKILELHPDAVFFDTDRMAAGFYRFANEHKIRIPEDIGVWGFDNDNFTKMLIPSLSTLAHPVEELSKAILEIIETAPEKPVCKTFKMNLKPRESVRYCG